MIVEFLLAHAPGSPQLQELAQEYGADRDHTTGILLTPW